MKTISGQIPADSIQATIALPEGAANVRCALFSSSANWRMIEFSSDGSEANYFVPVYSESDEAHIAADAGLPVTHVRIMGAAGDAYEVTSL